MCIRDRLLQLEERKKRLAAEGLFDPSKKKPIPFLPKTIGVITSPTGAVIRDILHRISDRFPSHVLLWRVLVQGDKAAEQIVHAIEGFNAIEPNGDVPRPDAVSYTHLDVYKRQVMGRIAAARG